MFFLLVAVISSFYFYANFPDRVPTHWNFAGEVDAWGSRLSAFIIPVVVIGVYLLFLALPYLDPKKEKYDQFKKVYHVFKVIIIAFMVLLYFLTSLNGLGYNVPIGALMPIIIGVMFVILGNYMSKLKSNWFIGIRTPWTLSSEEVWNKTHRFGGKMFILGGFLMAIQVFLPLAFRLPIFILTIALLTVGTFGYSYYIYRQEKKKTVLIDKK